MATAAKKTGSKARRQVDTTDTKKARDAKAAEKAAREGKSVLPASKEAADKLATEGQPPAMDPINKAQAATMAGELNTAQTQAKAKENGLEMVTVTIPRAFKLTGDDHQVHSYEPGTDEMPRIHAEHDYAIANGVEIVK